MIKVLLLEEVHNVGDIGDIVSVRNGYGRNFLIPSGKAMRATDEAIQIFEGRKAELLKQREERMSVLKEFCSSLDKSKLTIQANASADGKLYGSIGAGVIADEIKSQFGLDDKAPLRKDQIRIPGGGIKQTGDYGITVSLGKELKAEIALSVISGTGGSSDMSELLSSESAGNASTLPSTEPADSQESVGQQTE